MSRVKDITELVSSKFNNGSANELFWVFSGQVINVILGFVIIKLLSLMGSYDYGIYALAVTISSLLALVFYGPLQQGFIRFYYHYFEQNQIKVYLGTLKKTLFYSGVLLLLITSSVFIAAVYFNSGIPGLVFLFAGLSILSQRTGEFFNGLLNIIRKRKENALLQGGEKIFLALAFFMLLQVEKLDLVSVFISYAVILALFAAIKISVFLRMVPHQEFPPAESVPAVKKEINHNLITYMLPFLLWGISGWLQLNGEKWIIADLLSASQVGIYAVMMAVVNAFIAVPGNILSDFAMPVIFQNYSDITDSERVKTGYSYIRLNMVLTFSVTIVITLLTGVFGEDIIMLISTPEYAVYWYLLPVLCFGAGLFYTGQSLTLLGMALNQPKKYLAPKISAGILSVILNYILISITGLSGAAYAILATGLFYLIYIYIINKNILSSTGNNK